VAVATVVRGVSAAVEGVEVIVRPTRVATTPEPPLWLAAGDTAFGGDVRGGEPSPIPVATKVGRRASWARRVAAGA